jgi:HD-GYP domain-containing protein (c-di-GMP phosphodiesterase class II)
MPRTANPISPLVLSPGGRWEIPDLRPYPRLGWGNGVNGRLKKRPGAPPYRHGWPPLALVEPSGWGTRFTHPEPRQQATQVLFATLKSIDPETAAHSVRVTGLALRFGHHLGLPILDLEVLEITGILHDIGKIAIAADVLRKPAPLAPEEMAAIKRHPALGKAIVELLGFTPQNRLILHHHEHWNGRGYPQGLARDEIPLLSQVLCLADSYDALTSDRPYRQGCSHHQALAEIRASAGTQFSPELTREFLEMLES